MARKPKLTPSNDGYGTTHTVRIPLWPYLVTPIAVLAALPITGLVHHFYGGVRPGAGWTGFVLALGAVALAGFTAWASRPRGKVMQVMATGNVILAFLWIVPAVLDGPWTKAMIGTWFLGGLFMSVLVAVYRIMRQARGPEDKGVLQGEFVELGDAVKQLKDVRFHRTQITGAKATTAVSMPPGRSFSEVEGAKKEVASLLDVPVTAVRTVRDPDSERRGKVSVVPVDQLRDALPDPGPSCPGGSIAEPITLGRTEEGDEAAIILPGDPSVHRNAVGVMAVVGMSGSGKTELLLRLCSEAGTRHDNDLIIADARKGGQLPPWVQRLAKRKALGRNAAIDMLEDLPARVEARAKQLGDKGYKQWEQGCGIPFETYIVFEAAAVVQDTPVVDLAESVRSVGICLVLELQRATYDRLPTSARANITTWVVLGVQREEDAEAALSEGTVAAGAAPWKWKNGKPGYFYLEWAGRDEQSWSSPNRSYVASDEERAAHVAAVLGWDGQGEGAPATRVPEQETAEPVEEPSGVERNDAYDSEEPPDDVDASKPIIVPAGMPRISFEFGRKMAPDEARGILLQHLQDLANAGIEVVRPAQLGQVLGMTGLSGSWLRNELQELSKGDQPVLRYTPRGMYKILQPEPA